jgi:inosine/xanthosine triphosphate pyrophosphatase family protein
MRYADFRIVTSNERKLLEFRRYGLPIAAEAGADLPEVAGTPIEVILHKSLAAGIGRIVEDTSLDIEGAEVGCNIRWMIDRIGDFAGRPALWRVFLGANTGNEVRVFSGEVQGVIVDRRPVAADAFSFDPFFIPTGGERTLYDLEKIGLKDTVSARRIAAAALIADQPRHVFAVRDIARWTGAYQNV